MIIDQYFLVLTLILIELWIKISMMSWVKAGSNFTIDYIAKINKMHKMLFCQLNLTI